MEPSDSMERYAMNRRSALWLIAAIWYCPQPRVALAQEYNLGTLTKETVERLNNQTLRFDLSLARLDPAVLDDKAFMRYFILLNNCRLNAPAPNTPAATVDPRIVRALDNELDYPKIAAFYKTKAQGMLEGLSVSDGDLLITAGSLGTYDTAKSAFHSLFRDGRTASRLTVFLSTPPATSLVMRL